ncbi:MAG: hypothetical protein ACFCUX_07055 [Candidatus Methylacidiphilales bacterium]
MKKLLLLASLFILNLTAYADLQMPKRENFYDRMGHGVANILLSPTHILDSPYGLLQTDGPTVASTKGLTQGISRMFMDFFVGIAEVVTSPFPVESLKSPAYDTGVVAKYPPADLLENWY